MIAYLVHPHFHAYGEQDTLRSTSNLIWYVYMCGVWPLQSKWEEFVYVIWVESMTIDTTFKFIQLGRDFDSMEEHFKLIVRFRRVSTYDLIGSILAFLLVSRVSH